MEYNIIVQSQDKNQTFKLDLFGNEQISVIFNVVDVRAPESLKSNYTKEFIIPATKENNKFFEGILYEGYTTNKFNPNLKVSCQLNYDNTTLIDGFLQIVKVNKNDNKLDSYSIIIYGELSNVFKQTEGLYLNDLDLSEYNHIWSYENVVHSWDISVIKNNIPVPFIKGNGYVYPFEHRGQSGSEDTASLDVMNVENFFPSIYVKTIIDSIFTKTNNKYNSKFFNSSFFRGLVLPYTKGHMYIDEEAKKLKEFSAVKTSEQFVFKFRATVPTTSPTNFITFQNKVDPGNIFLNQISLRPKNKQSSLYAIKLKLKLNFRAAVSPSALWKIIGPEFIANVYLKNSTTGVIIASNNISIPYPKATAIGPAGMADATIDLILDYNGYFAELNNHIINVTFTMPDGPENSKFISINGGDVNGEINCFVMPESEVVLATTDSWLFEGDKIVISSTLPDNILIKDFLTSLNKMFNLYWVANKDGGFDIEPRDTFYNKSDVRILDWTQKIDETQEITISPLQEIDAKTYFFHKTPDNDYYNKLYTISNKEIYGERKIEVENDYVTSTKEIVPIFSPTILLSYKGTDRIVNTIADYADGFFETYDGNIRISQYGGVKSTSQPWLFKHKGNSDGAQYSKYPYSGHYDDPMVPTKDINYGQAKHYLYSWKNTTTSNLYNDFWKNTINDLTAIDSHIWKGKMRLKYFDIIDFNLFDTIQVNQVYYKINSVSYNAITEIAEVELFKANSFGGTPSKLGIPVTTVSEVYTDFRQETELRKITGWQSTTFKNKFVNLNEDVLRPTGIYRDVIRWQRDTTGGVLAFKNNESMTKAGNIQQKSFGIGPNIQRNVNANIYEKGAFIELNGVNNNVGPQSSSIKALGNNNQIQQRCKNISIVGNNNFIDAGLTNVTVIGDNQYITKSNTSYINGTVISNGFITQDFNFINASVNEVQNPFESSVNGNFIQCGKNAVQNIGGVTKKNKIISPVLFDTNRI